MFSFDFMYIIVGLQAIVVLLLIYFLDATATWRRSLSMYVHGSINTKSEPRKIKDDIGEELEKLDREIYYLFLLVVSLVFLFGFSVFFIVFPAELNINTKG